MKKILILIACILLPFPVLAKSRFSVVSSENTLTITGSCDTDVRLVLLKDKSETAIYSSGTPCHKGSFSYSDDLTQWNIPEGTYTLLVDNTPSREGVTIKKVVPVSAPVASTSEHEKTKESAQTTPSLNAFEQSVNDFGTALQSMSQSLGVIEENLSRSDYAGNTAKRVIVGFLRETLESLAGFFTEFKDTNEDLPPVPDTVTPQAVVTPLSTGETTTPAESVQTIQEAPQTDTQSSSSETTTDQVTSTSSSSPETATSTSPSEASSTVLVPETSTSTETVSQ